MHPSLPFVNSRKSFAKNLEKKSASLYRLLIPKNWKPKLRNWEPIKSETWLTSALAKKSIPKSSKPLKTALLKSWKKSTKRKWMSSRIFWVISRRPNFVTWFSRKRNELTGVRLPTSGISGHRPATLPVRTVLLSLPAAKHRRSCL